MAQAQRDWFEKDYYKTLGVSKTASDKEIQRAYRKLAKAHHPDANPGHDDRFKEISAAYDVLSDADKRIGYDEAQRLGPASFNGGPTNGGPFTGGSASPGGAGFGSATNFSFGGDDLGDLFGSLFGRQRPGGGTSRAGGRRGNDVEAELHLSFIEALEGVTTTVNVTTDATCATCHGAGAAPGTSPVVCARCSGRGVLADNQGPFSLSRPCPDCGGRGMRVESPCPTCRGTGTERRARQVKVRIPAGVDEGQRIRIKGRGGPGHSDGPPGDLFVTARVADHSLFRRKGRDLLLTLPVTFAEAALGAEVAVPVLDASAGRSNDPGSGSRSIVLRIPAGTRAGRTFRVKGRGVAAKKGVGDLLVSVEVTVPTTLSDAERHAIEALAAASTETPRAHLDRLVGTPGGL